MSVNSGAPGVMVGQGLGAAGPPHGGGGRPSEQGPASKACPATPARKHGFSGAAPHIRHLPEARLGCGPVGEPSLMVPTARQGRAVIP